MTPGDDGQERSIGGLAFTCPACGEGNYLYFDDPEKGGKHTAIVKFYGDESVTDDPSAYSYVYAFVGMLPPAREAATIFLNEAKRKLRPDIDPSTWCLHAREIRNNRLRAELGLTQTLAEVDHILGELMFMIFPASPKIISVTVVPPHTTKDWQHPEPLEKVIRERAIRLAIMATISAATANGYGCEFVLESRGLDHEQNGIDYDVELIGRGLRTHVGFHYVTRGKLVGLPITASKKTLPPIPELEIADLVAYAVRRFLDRKRRGLKVELHLETLGRLLWILEGPRQLHSIPCEGFPPEFLKRYLGT